jgi:ribosome-associated protein
LAGKAREALQEKKGEDVVILDVRNLSSIADFYLLATGTSHPHLKALYNAVLRSLKEDGVHCRHKAGDPESGWLVMDYVDVVIHILSPEARRYYAIEELWAQIPRLP